jgi:uncharacterized Tic20 family protein
METPPLMVAPAVPKGNDKIWSVLSHLSSFIGVPFLLPLVVYLVMNGESEYVAANAREALNFHITILIYCLCCVPLVFLLIGIPMLIVIGLGSFICSIIAAVKASEGGCYHYPLTLRLVS